VNQVLPAHAEELTVLLLGANVLSIIEQMLLLSTSLYGKRSSAGDFRPVSGSLIDLRSWRSGCKLLMGSRRKVRQLCAFAAPASDKARLRITLTTVTSSSEATLK
jgi:hypothetical protein